MNSKKPNDILKIPLCTPTSHFGGNFCFTDLPGGKAKLILKYRGMNTPSFQATISIHGNPPITVNYCLKCGKTNSRLNCPENTTNLVKKPFHFWRKYCYRTTKWIHSVWEVFVDSSALTTKKWPCKCLDQEVILPPCSRILCLKGLHLGSAEMHFQF